MAANVVPFQVLHAGDASGLLQALRDPGVARAQTLIVLAKVPGPATLNDPSRELAQRAFRAAIKAIGGEVLLSRCRLIVSVGCEGIGSAGGWLLIEDGAEAGSDARLCMAMAETGVIPVPERGGPAHVAAVAEAVRTAMRAARLDRDAVRLVLVKSPVCRDQADATGRSRGAAALGVAVALGEVDRVTDGEMADPSLYCTRAMTMSGTEVDRAELVVLGNRAGAGGDLVVGSRLLRDIIDVGGARRLLLELGAGFDADGVLRKPLGLVLLKAGLRPDGLLRGRPTQVLGTDLPPDKHLRAAASGMLASVLGSNDAFITGGAEHQAPPGGCVLAAIARAP